MRPLSDPSHLLKLISRILLNHSLHWRNIVKNIGGGTCPGCTPNVYAYVPLSSIA